MIGLASVLLAAAFNLYDNHTFYGSSGRGALPDLTLFRDQANNAIGVACIDHPPVANLQKLGVPDWSQRLDALEKANDIRVADGRCSLTFPVFAGARRRELQSIVDQVAKRLAPRVALLAQRVRVAAPERPELVFHLLWSRVMDDAWEKLWTSTFSSAGPPDAFWVIYPPQRVDVGTNSGSVPGGGSYALTWSPAFRPHLRELSQSIIDSFRLAWEKEIPGDAAARLRLLGCLSPDSRLKVFTFHAADPTANLFEKLTSDYADLLRGVYDYAAIGKRFDVPPERMFLILGHETAYAILDRLDRSGTLKVPFVLLRDSDGSESLRLISLELGDPPGAESDAMYDFVKSGWRGNQHTAKEFRRVVESNPANLNAWLYLGMSLYEIGDYRAAIAAFDALTAHAANDLRIRDWGRIWSAQMHDLLGERDRAIELYRTVSTSDDEQTMMFGQYGIGPISAHEWAKERLQVPFTRR